MQGVERTSDLFKVAFLKEGRVGDRTYEHVERRERKVPWRNDVTRDDEPLCGKIEHERCTEAVAWKVDVGSACEVRFGGDRVYETRTDRSVLCRLGAYMDDDEHEKEEGWCVFSPYFALTASSHFGKASTALTSAS